MSSPNLYLKTLKPICQNLHSRSSISQLHNHSYSKHIVSNPAIEFALYEAETIRRSQSHFTSPTQQNEEQPIPLQKHGPSAKVQRTHPWTEWVDLMQVMMKKGYFKETGNPIEKKAELGKKDANLIRTACLNFARDHYQLIRYLSQKDIMVIVGSGCPSTDRKVVNSAKRLRAHVGIEEGNVCSSCILRGDCDRAYVKAREDEGGRTVDVMRILFTYCLDPILGSVENKPRLNRTIKESVRALVKQIVNIRVDEHDNERPKSVTSGPSIPENDIAQERDQRNAQMKQGDWICPKCNFINFARNIKCLHCDDFNEERLKVIRADQDRLPLKKGDWMCEKCNCLNFARNTKCYVCKSNPPKRQLNPGEWQCESCNYINFRKNMLCLKCDHRRPIASNAASLAPQVVSNGARHQETRPFLEQHNQISNKRIDAINFTEEASLDYISSSTWNPDVMNIPVIGGKSKLSQNVRRQEEQPGKLEMADRNRFGHLTTSDDDDDGDDFMAEWFREGTKF